MREIENVELTFYYTDGNNECIELSPIQMAVVLKILGISRVSEDNVTCFSDKSLQKLINMKGNPLNLIPLQEEKKE